MWVYFDNVFPEPFVQLRDTLTRYLEAHRDEASPSSDGVRAGELLWEHYYRIRGDGSGVVITR